MPLQSVTAFVWSTKPGAFATNMLWTTFQFAFDSCFVLLLAAAIAQPAASRSECDLPADTEVSRSRFSPSRDLVFSAHLLGHSSVFVILLAVAT